MLKAITHFEQVPLFIVMKIMEREQQKRLAAQAGEQKKQILGATNQQKEIAAERGK